jgi:hypothetical protein
MIKKKQTFAILTTLIAYIVGRWPWVKDTLISFTPVIRFVIIVVVSCIISLAFVWSIWPEWIMSLI